MKLYAFCELGRGGISDYAHDQANALADQGVDVVLYCAPALIEGRELRYDARPVLADPRVGKATGSKVVRQMALARSILANFQRLHRDLARLTPAHLLVHFSEYLAPLWAWRLKALRQAGWKVHTILHDPKREHVVGPEAWHRLSVEMALAQFDTIFVHTNERGDCPPSADVARIPYGIHAYPPPQKSRSEVRRELGIPEAVNLLTAFGFIRDNKNLDLVIDALKERPEFVLLVAGTEQGGGNKPISVYRERAEAVGVADRVIWRTRFHSQQEVADILSASDLSVQTYARSFRSSSAALGVTFNYRLPCLVSSGAASTRELIEGGGVGLWVEPDDSTAIADALARFLTDPPKPDWHRFTYENSWAMNATLVRRKLWGEAGLCRAVS
ncbi:MAG: glycosyltransferase family 4 protein [Hyphomicrobium sp.]|nr:glycosyltransferase family 4 protein [Hyphomicrobium sp.]